MVAVVSLFNPRSVLIQARLHNCCALMTISSNMMYGSFGCYFYAILGVFVTVGDGGGHLVI